MSTESLSASSVRHPAFQDFEKIRNICEKFRIISLNRQLEAAEGLLGDNTPIDVAILGQFKAGKSSFINSVIQESVLPVGVVPVTTVISRLQYGPEKKAIVTFFDGTRSEVDINRLDEFTSEAKNPSNQKNVEIVDIELPSLKDYPGVRLVDTPGLGSVFAYHHATSENWLPEVGAALLAISSDRPLSENDLQLIRELAQHTPNIIILLTKTDLLTPDQQQEVTDFFIKTLKREINRDFPIFMFSTKNGVEKYRKRFEAEILLKLSDNRDFEFGKILQYKKQSLVKSCLSYLDLALKTSLQTDQDREELRRQVLDEKVNFELIREELGIIARENQKQTRNLINSYLEPFFQPLAKKLRENLRREMTKWNYNLYKFTRRYEDWLEETMKEELQKISKSEHQHFYGTLKKSRASLSRSLHSFRALLNSNVEKALGIRLAESEWQISVDEPEQPDIKTVRALDFHFDLIWFLIPMTIFKPVFERIFLGKIHREVETNIARLAAQWEERINRSIEDLKKQSIKYVKDELATIDSLLASTYGESEEIKNIINDLDSERIEQ